LDQIVTHPNFEDAGENALRRVLLSIRHGSLWRQLPRNTEWYEVEVHSADLHRIRVFPRAQWRKVARGNFAATDVTQYPEAEEFQNSADEAFLTKLENLRDLVRRDYDGGAVLLIGENASGPFTILDGNHRLVAAMLEAPERVERYRFFCGLSHKMAQCCWYETNVATLTRYAANLLRYLAYDPKAELVRLLQSSEAERASLAQQE